MKNFTTIATFTYPNEYAILRLILENEMIIEVFLFYLNAIGGINLKVHFKDLQTAKHIINNFKFHSHLKIV